MGPKKKCIAGEMQIRGAREQLEEWLKTEMGKTMTVMNCVVVIGPSSCGKTTLVREVCESSGYLSYYITSYNCNNSKDLLEHLEKSVQYNLLNALENRSVPKPKVVIIDDIDILLSADRCIISSFYEFITRRRIQSAVRFICISSTEKKLGDLKRYCRIIICPPATADAILLFLQRTETEKTPIEELRKIAESSHGSFAVALNRLQSHSTEESRAEDTMAIEAINSSLSFETLFKGPTRDIARNIIEEDSRMIPLRFHENVPRELLSRTYESRKRTYIDILWTCVQWDLMMVPTDQHAFATEYFLQAPCAILPGAPYTRGGEGGTSNEELQEFTKLLSRLSLQRKSARILYQTGVPWKHAPYLMFKKSEIK